jgi:hypothetical protein
MNLNRKSVLAGLAATGITVGALAAGGGVAVASTGPAQVSAMPTATASPHVQCSGYGHDHGNHKGMWHGHNAVGKAIAGYLGLSQDQLRSQVESGKSLADVAGTQGKSVAGLESTIVKAVTSQVNSSGLSADQKSMIISAVKSHVGQIVNATCSPSATPMPTAGTPTGTTGP